MLGLRLMLLLSKSSSHLIPLSLLLLSLSATDFAEVAVCPFHFHQLETLVRSGYGKALPWSFRAYSSSKYPCPACYCYQDSKSFQPSSPPSPPCQRHHPIPCTGRILTSSQSHTSLSVSFLGLDLLDSINGGSSFRWFLLIFNARSDRFRTCHSHFKPPLSYLSCSSEAYYAVSLVGAHFRVFTPSSPCENRPFHFGASVDTELHNQRQGSSVSYTELHPRKSSLVASPHYSQLLLPRTSRSARAQSTPAIKDCPIDITSLFGIKTKNACTR